MSRPHRPLSAAEAAAHLGVSAKALRVYERHGLIAPGRSAAGWRLYDRADLERAEEILSLRRVGLGLAQIRRILAGAPDALQAGSPSRRSACPRRPGRLPMRCAGCEA